MNSPSLKEFRAMSDDQLIEKHDLLAKNTIVGTQHFLDEIARREQSKQTEAMLSYTRWITWMTVIVALATIVNLVIAYLLFRKP
jgi:uncharacterized membrane protein YukC